MKKTPMKRTRKAKKTETCGATTTITKEELSAAEAKLATEVVDEPSSTVAAEEVAAATDTETTPDVKVLVTLDRAELQEVLRIALDFVSKASTLPILNHVHFKAKETVCTISATDLDISWTRIVPCRGLLQGVAVDIAIPADVFFKEVKALDAAVQEVELCFDKGESVSINGRCEINTLSGEDFPLVPDAEGAEYRVEALSSLLARVLPAVSTDETRYNINGVFLDLKKGRVVGTDGHRLHHEETEVADASFVLPRRAVHLITRHPASHSFKAGEKSFSIRLGSGIMTAKLVEGDYPDYEKVMLKDLPVKVFFRSGELLKILEGALPLVADGISLTINGQIIVKSQKAGLGNYKWHFACKTEGKGSEDLVFGVNPRYLVDAVKAYAGKDADVTMEMTDTMSPVRVNGKAIIMPMRLKEEVQN